MLKPLPRKPMLKPEDNIPEKVKNKSSDEGKKPRKQLPSDEYKDEVEPLEVEVDENRKIILSVKRGGEFGLPMCDVRQFQTTEMYTGFTKKGINFPIELLPDLITELRNIQEACEEKEIL